MIVNANGGRGVHASKRMDKGVSTQSMICHVMPLIRPTAGSASWLKAWGEKSRSPLAHPTHLSVNLTKMVLPWSGIDKDQWGSMRKNEFHVQVTLAVLPHSGFRFGLPPLV